MSCIVLGGPEDHTQVQQFVRRTQKTQHVLILMAMVYYSEGTQAKAAKGKGKWDEAWRKPGTDFQKSFPSGVTKDVLNPFSNEL